MSLAAHLDEGAAHLRALPPNWLYWGRFRAASCAFIAHALAAYFFLDEERARLRDEGQDRATLGDARREVQRLHWCHVLDWIHQQCSSGITPAELHALLVA